MATISEQAENLHINLNGKKKDDIVLDVCMANNLENRVAISQYYKATYETSLFDDIKSKIGGDFGLCAALMFLTPLEFCIYHLKIGLKKQSGIAMEQITSKTPEELKIIEDAYNKDTGKDLKTDITKSFSGSVGRNLLNLFDTERTINPKPNKEECEKYATTLVKAEPKIWTEDESLFKEIFIKRSPEEIILIARFYLKMTGINLLDMVEKKTKGKNQLLLKEILYNNITPHELYAEKIRGAIKGLGTDEDTLSRVLVSRCELDMPAIRDIYLAKYKCNMKDDIKDDTSGAYLKICSFLGEK